MSTQALGSERRGPETTEEGKDGVAVDNPIRASSSLYQVVFQASAHSVSSETSLLLLSEFKQTVPAFRYTSALEYHLCSGVLGFRLLGSVCKPPFEHG